MYQHWINIKKNMISIMLNSSICNNMITICNYKDMWSQTIQTKGMTDLPGHIYSFSQSQSSWEQGLFLSSNLTFRRWSWGRASDHSSPPQAPGGARDGPTGSNGVQHVPLLRNDCYKRHNWFQLVPVGSS